MSNGQACTLFRASKEFVICGTKPLTPVQFYLSSLPVDAQLKGRAIRQHWGIENQVHWSLDVTFNEDKSRIRSLNSPQNFALVRRIALNAVNKETTLQLRLRQKIKRAAMNNDYMMQILKCFCQA